MIDESAILKSIAGFLGKSPDELQPQTVLKDLVAESFALVELVVELQEVFGIQLQSRDIKDVHTVQQLVDVVRRASA